MEKNEDILKKVVAHAKEYGFIFPSSEIYDGLSAVYDYGQNGVELKNNIKNYWWKYMVHEQENIYGLDAAIFMHPKTWKASGHVDAFNDPMVDNKDSKKRYRADVLIEDFLDKIDTKIENEIKKGKKRFGETFDEQTYRETNPNILRNKEKRENVYKRFVYAMEESDLNDLKKIIEENKIVCPISGSANWTDVRQFNLMFNTKIGASEESASTIYLRPETAQGIFVNFLNVQKTARAKVPFGIAQIGKAFRNEIIARQFIFRMREFEQMEMQFFIPPGTEMKWYEHWKEKRLQWHLDLGFDTSNYRFHDHDNLAHYANAACDIQFKFPMGFKELEGIHSRTDFDLGNHQELSKKKLQYFDTAENKSYVPYVLETSIGLDRMFLSVLCQAFEVEKLGNDAMRIVLKIPKFLAPVKVAVLPLINKDGLPELSQKIFDSIKKTYPAIIESKDSIGKRYRRQDAIGTPFAVTVDHESIKSNTVTVRERDSMKQERISLDALVQYLSENM